MASSTKTSCLVVTVSLAALWAGTAPAALPAKQRCEAAKLRAQGKLLACLEKQRVNVVRGKADESAECWSRFQTALQKANSRAVAKGTSCRFIDNGDGTVSDLNTGLLWEKKTNLDGWANWSDPHDADNEYTWSVDALSPWPPSGTAFTQFLAALNYGTSTDGFDTATACFLSYCDWRLPTIEELEGIFDLTRPGCDTGPRDVACISSVFGPTQPYSHWSATVTTSPIEPGYAYLFDFDGFGTYTIGRGNVSYVRAVRGGL